MPRSAELALAVLAGLVAGLAVGWLLKPSYSPPRAPLPGAYELATEPSTSTQRPPEKSASRDAPAAETYAAAVDVQPAPALAPQPQADGVITGLVLLHDGRPCVGLALAATPPFPDTLSPIRHSALLPEERYAYETRAYEWAVTRRRSGTSGGDGSFEIRGIGDGRYRLTSETGEYRLEPAQPGDPLSVEAGAHVVLTATPILRVELDVILDTGEVPDYAIVRLIRPGDSSWNVGPERWTPAMRSFPVLPGTLQITGEAGPDLVWRGEVVVDVPDAGLNQPLRLELKAVNALIIQGIAQQPYYCDVTFLIYPADTLEPGWPQRPWDFTTLRSAGGSQRSVRLRSVFHDVAPGKYVVFALPNSVQILGRMEVEYLGGLQEAAFPLSPLVREDFFVLRPFGPDGLPLRGVTVGVNLTQTNFGYMLSTALEQPDGSWWVHRTPPENFFSTGSTPRSDAQYRIEVNHPRYGRRVVLYGVQDRHDLEIRFGERSILTVRLDNFPERRGGLALYAFPADADERRETDEHRYRPSAAPRVLQESTRFELASGPIRILLVRSLGDFSGYATLLRHSMELPSGEHEVQLTVPSLFDLVVRLPPEPQINNLRVRGPLGEIRLDASPEGLAKASSLPQGTYLLSCSTAGGSGMWLQVPYMGEVAYMPRTFNALRVSYLDNTGVLERAGLRKDDLVLAINGARHEGSNALRQAWNDAGSAAAVRLEVLRDGRTMMFTISGNDFSAMQGHWTVPTLAPE
jgi:hypothetical protein